MELSGIKKLLKFLLALYFLAYSQLLIIESALGYSISYTIGIFFRYTNSTLVLR